MSKEGDRLSVLQTTKVKTSLKGDDSWIQRRLESQQEQKPWLAEVRVTRADGAFTEPSSPSPSTAPTATQTPEPSPATGNPASVITNTTPITANPASAITNPTSDTTSQGGVFTKTNNENVAVANGASGTSSTFIKRPTESYKKIAPHIVRSNLSSSTLDDESVTSEEQDRRIQAASNVLKSSSAPQRSYVLSAAKKYGNTEKPSDSSVSFVAKRVVIEEDRKDTPKDGAISPAVTQQKPALQSVTPSSTKVDILVSPDITAQSSVKTQIVVPSSDPAPIPSASPKDTGVVPEQKVATANPFKTSSKDVKQVLDQKMKSEIPPAKTSSVETLKVSSLSLPDPVPLTSTSPKDTKPVVDQTTKIDIPPIKTGSVGTQNVSPGSNPTPGSSTSPKDTKLILDQKTKTDTTPVKTSSLPKAQITEASKNLENEDLISLVESGEKLVDILPSEPEWTKSQTDQKTSFSLDKLAEDVIPFNTNVIDLSTHNISKGTSQSTPAQQPTNAQSSTKSTTTMTTTAQNTQVINSTIITKQKVGLDFPSGTQTVTTSVTKTVSTDPVSLKQTSKSTDISVMDPFDPFAVDTPKSSLGPASPRKSTEDSLEAAKNPSGDQSNFTVFEKKTPQSISTWDKWTSSAVLADESENNEANSPPSSPMDRTSEAFSQETNTLDTESKKSFVLLKEYVTTRNAGTYAENIGSDDYISSSSSSYSYSSPPSYSSDGGSCTYCGKPVGSEAKITIEHLNIFCHPACFKCGVCGRPMGDLLYSMFLHHGVVHCESCYSNTI